MIADENRAALEALAVNATTKRWPPETVAERRRGAPETLGGWPPGPGRSPPHAFSSPPFVPRA